MLVDQYISAHVTQQWSPSEKCPCRLCTWRLWWSWSACPPPRSPSFPLRISWGDCHSIWPAGRMRRDKKQKHSVWSRWSRSLACLQSCQWKCMYVWWTCACCTHQFRGFTDRLWLSEVHYGRQRLTKGDIRVQININPVRLKTKKKTLLTGEFFLFELNCKFYF